MMKRKNGKLHWWTVKKKPPRIFKLPYFIPPRYFSGSVFSFVNGCLSGAAGKNFRKALREVGRVEIFGRSNVGLDSMSSL